QRNMEKVLVLGLLFALSIVVNSYGSNGNYPDDCPNVFCFIGPCTIQTCSNFPMATCVAVCPCTSLWFFNGEDVSNQC
uniref:Uncharacterized protein n=1 Tax=Magallana gigas TaxID=29159 RepID=A0A8W8P2R7_MAGGI